jgi:hypothetical protein
MSERRRRAELRDSELSLPREREEGEGEDSAKEKEEKRATRGRSTTGVRAVHSTSIPSLLLYLSVCPVVA